MSKSSKKKFLFLIAVISTVLVTIYTNSRYEFYNSLTTKREIVYLNFKIHDFYKTSNHQVKFYLNGLSNLTS